MRLRSLDRCYAYPTVMTDLVLREVGIALSVRTQTLDIDFAYRHRVLPLEAFAHGYDIAILGYIGTAAKDHIGRALAYSGTGIDIAAMDAGRLLGNHLTTEGMLAHDTVAGGEVEDQLRALYRQLCRRRQRAPEVLTELDTETIAAGLEHQIHAKGHIPAP